MDSSSKLDCVFITEWIEEVGGGEAVLLAAKESFPQSRVYSLVNRSSEILSDRCSLLQRFPRFKKEMMAVFSLLSHQMWRGKYDLVITFSHLFAHTARVWGSKNAIRINYVHTPARYLWFPDIDSRGLIHFRYFTNLLLKFLRRVDTILQPKNVLNIANSNYVANRIFECWKQDAIVCYPPVDTEYFSKFVKNKEGMHSLISAGRLVKYKRFDRVVRTAACLNWKLTIIGDGPERDSLLQLARELNVELELMHFAEKDIMAQKIANASVFVFGGIEDFGILPVEAMACGTPVVGLAEGGLLETVSEKGGVLVKHENHFPRACLSALRFDPFEVSRETSKFSKSRFKTEFSALVLDYYSEQSKSS